MSSVFISLGYNSSISHNLKKNLRATIPSIFDHGQINLRYLIHSLKLKSQNILTDCQIINGKLIDKNFPELGNLFKFNPSEQIDILKDKINLFYSTLADKNIYKIIIYYTHEIVDKPDDFIKLFPELSEIISEIAVNYNLVVISCSEKKNIYKNLHKKVFDIGTGLNHEQFHSCLDRIIFNLDPNGNAMIQSDNNNPTNLTDKLNKKIKIAILLSGQWRDNPTGMSKNPNHQCQIGLTDVLYTDLLKLDLSAINSEIVQIDIFAATDNCNIEQTLNTYPNIKSIYLSNTDKMYGHQIDIIDIIQKQSELVDQTYTRMKKFEGKYNIGYNTVQWFRLYVAYNMMKRYQVENNINYDIVIRTRPDIYFTSKISTEMIINTVKSDYVTYMSSDLFSVMTHKIADIYGELILAYGSNLYSNQIYDFDTNGIWDKQHYYNGVDQKKWAFSPEAQLVEHLMSKVSIEKKIIRNIFHKLNIVKFSPNRRK